MAGYIGDIPVPQATQTRQSFTATASQTSFPTIGFTPGFCDVYLNGIKLLRNVDFDDSNGSDILLTTGAALNDILEVTIFDTFTTSSGTTTNTTHTSATLKSNVTLKNDTEEDSVGGRASKIIYQGEQSGGEISTLAEIEASHDLGNDDEKGNLVFRTNDGSDGTSPTEAMRIDSSGRVGIGDNNPDVPLMIAKDGTSHTAAAITIKSTQAGGYGSILNFESTQAGRSAVTAASIGTEGAENYSDAANTSSVLKFSTIEDGTFAEKWRITKEGNFKPATNGKGIDFSASENSGVVTDGSILADYEEGTFTGTVTGYYGNPSSAVTATGQYTVIGNMVHYAINFENVNTTGASGDINVTGLPFAHSGSYTISGCQMSPFGVYPSSSPYAVISGTIAYFRKHVDSGTDSACFHSAGTGRYLRLDGTYKIS